LRRLLNEDEPNDSIILFTIVSEPPPSEDDDDDDEVVECQDIAVAEISLLDVMREREDATRITATLWDMSGELRLGTITIAFQGCDVLHDCRYS
jgi:hypothetical protein